MPNGRSSSGQTAALPLADHPVGHPEPGETDGELMLRCTKRDGSALAQLYDRHSPAVMGVCRSILRDTRLAEEVTHDVFLGLWQNPGAFQTERGAYVPWLLRVARNRSIDVLRRQRDRPFSIVQGDHLDHPQDPTAGLIDPGENPADIAVARADGVHIRSAVESLSPSQQEVIELAFWRGMTQAEIAAELNRPLGTVKTQIRVAMKRLADRLRPLQTEMGLRSVEPLASDNGARLPMSIQPTTGVEAPDAQ